MKTEFTAVPVSTLTSYCSVDASPAQLILLCADRKLTSKLKSPDFNIFNANFTRLSCSVSVLCTVAVWLFPSPSSLWPLFISHHFIEDCVWVCVFFPVFWLILPLLSSSADDSSVSLSDFLFKPLLQVTHADNWYSALLLYESHARLPLC